MDWTDAVLRTLLAALVGFGFIAPTGSAVLAIGGADPGVAAVAGMLGGFCSFIWIGYTSNWAN